MARQSSVDAEAVKEANRRVYDALAADYEGVDGRRTDSLRDYLVERLRVLRARAPGGRLLDLGCGSGFLSSCAEGIFDHRAGMDLSPKMLALASGHLEEARVGDVEAIPWPDETFDAVACFAVLHHLPRDLPWIREVRRVLRPGGVLYTDHDLEARFRERAAIPFGIFRRLRGHEEEYSRRGLSAADRRLAEFREDGVDSGFLVRALRQEGFEVEARFHWFGLHPLTDRIFGRRTFPRGLAPLLRIEATRP